ncbi:hypothetical protein AMAG_00971 [Allomyces macrogynus ATCC 38327]|uniref:Uncharacterized protein n=1 Tax=Allomyces macrogynus (strain ATCC 38327) TaxID=578462 RepID=A0A0L0RY78_ALLM3|nr:hypothetical protein AMAG_00971 [Allomyces macrogynus ATCC 38327]|eukprot:KNE55034.1 hypothetical protein AMAG_00971 [Allomyces macrogynus ATCC 38327]
MKFSTVVAAVVASLAAVSGVTAADASPTNLSPIVAGKPSMMHEKKNIKCRHLPTTSPAFRRATKMTVPQLKAKIRSLPAGSPLRRMYECRLATVKRTKTQKLMSVASPHPDNLMLTPFGEQGVRMGVSCTPDRVSCRVTRDGITRGSGAVHRYGFQTRLPIVIPTGADYVTILAQVRVDAMAPSATSSVCRPYTKSITLLHGVQPLRRIEVPRGQTGMPAGVYEPLSITVPASILRRNGMAPIVIRAAHDHASTTNMCLDRSYLEVKNFKVVFHDDDDPLPSGIPSYKHLVPLRGTAYSVAEDAYDYDAFNDDAHDGSDFLVDEDAFGEDMWDDGTGFSLLDGASTYATVYQAGPTPDMTEFNEAGNFSVADGTMEDEE